MRSPLSPPTHASPAGSRSPRSCFPQQLFFCGFWLLATPHMTRRGLSCVAPKCGIVCSSLYVLIFLSLDAVGFRASPWASRGGTGRRDTCVRMAAWRGTGEPRGKEQEAINGINLASPCSRKDMLHSVSLFAEILLLSSFMISGVMQCMNGCCVCVVPVATYMHIQTILRHIVRHIY